MIILFPYMLSLPLHSCLTFLWSNWTREPEIRSSIEINSCSELHIPIGADGIQIQCQIGIVSSCWWIKIENVSLFLYIFYHLLLILLFRNNQHSGYFEKFSKGTLYTDSLQTSVYTDSWEITFDRTALRDILSTTSFLTDVNKCMFLCSFPWERENTELE